MKKPSHKYFAGRMKKALKALEKGDYLKAGLLANGALEAAETDIERMAVMAIHIAINLKDEEEIKRVLWFGTWDERVENSGRRSA